MSGANENTQNRETAISAGSKLLSSELTLREFKQALTGYILANFGLEERIREEDIYKLAVLSIKKPAADSNESKYDCHQTNAAVRKKILLILNVEKLLGIELEEAEKEKIQTIDNLVRLSYSRYIWRKTVKAWNSPREKFDVDKIRADFPMLRNSATGASVIYFDNAATTHKPQAVLDAIVRFYSEQNSNIRRGLYRLGRDAAEHCEQARETVRKFINAGSLEEVIFTKGATDSLNLLAASFCEAFLEPGGNVIATEFEHNSNLLPWRFACGRKNGDLRLIPIKRDGTLELNALESLIDEKTAIVAVTASANSTGFCPPLAELIRIAHQHHVPVLADGAQSVQHFRTDVQALDCDFFCFSGHKVYGPMGIGVLYGKKQYLEKMPSYQYGGGMAKDVIATGISFQNLPDKFEAGTQNIAGILGLEAAIRYVEQIGLDRIEKYESQLTNYAMEQLRKIKGVKLIGPLKKRGPIISFFIEGMSLYDTGMLLDAQGIAVRFGTHCAQLAMAKLGLAGSVRISFAIYNTKDEVDLFCERLELQS